jgi:hypothetical protein
MAMTVQQTWQHHRKRLAELRRAEAKALSAIHKSFKGATAGPTHVEYSALATAQGAIYRHQKHHLIPFLKKNRK